MDVGGLALVASAFVASAVETVEAVTIVLAVGIVRGWRWTLTGVATALLVLTAMVAIVGPGLVRIPINYLRLVVGALLLTFGLQWLRKAILRASGWKPLHDETAIFAREAARGRELPPADPHTFDGYAFTVAFKGVLLEGLEVAFIVLTFGAAQGNVPAAAAGAGAAVALVTAGGVIARRPLARIPENTLKLAVGVMLTSFGIFWAAEGAGVSWPDGDATLPLVVLGTVLFTLAAVALLRRESSRAVSGVTR